MPRERRWLLISSLLAAVACEQKTKSVTTAPKTASAVKKQETATAAPKPQAKKKADPAQLFAPLPDAKELPETFFGAWVHKKFWGKGRTQGPHHWLRVTITKGTRLEVSGGEVSKDSGSRGAVGVYTVVSGAGSKEQPFLLRYHVRKLRNSGTTGYDNDYPLGKITEAKLYLMDGKLNFSMDKVGSYTLSRLVLKKK